MAASKRSKANTGLGGSRINTDLELFEMVGDHTHFGSTGLDLVTKREIGAAVRETYRVLVGLAQVAAGQEDEAKAEAEAGAERTDAAGSDPRIELEA